MGSEEADLDPFPSAKIGAVIKNGRRIQTAPRLWHLAASQIRIPLSPKDLTLALRVLEPRPYAVLVGKGYSEEEETTETRNVLAEYLKELGVDDGDGHKDHSESI